MRRLVLCLAVAACGGVGPGGAVSSGLSFEPGTTGDLSRLVTLGGAGSAITWTMATGSLGTITSAGVYTAPSCAVVLMNLPAGTVVANTAQITDTDTVNATWSGGTIPVTVTIAEKVLSVQVSPSSASLGFGATQQFTETTTYTCHTGI